MTTTNDTPQLIAVDLLDPHPDNPRIVRRDDVIDQIAAEIAEHGFGAEHAILVRPKGDRYEVISGHNRRDAAIKAGVDTVPAWVREMDDDEAFWRLRLDNAQGELSPLEEGKHLGTYVGRDGKGGRGKTGGLNAYAARLRMDDDNAPGRTALQRRARAWAVFGAYLETGPAQGRFTNEDPPPDFTVLAELGAAPRSWWSHLVGQVIRHGWTYDQATVHASALKTFAATITDQWQKWLPLTDVFDRYLAGSLTTAAVKKLTTAADDVARWIDEHGWDVEGQQQDFTEWLIEEEISDPRKIGRYKAMLIEEKGHRDAEAARAAYEAPGWYQGRWEDNVDKLADGSVALLLTDPPYGMGYVSNMRKERHAPIIGDTAEPYDIAFDMATRLMPKLSDDAQVLVFCASDTESAVATMAGLRDAGLRVRKTPLVWDKGSGGMGDLDRDFAPRYELIVHATKGDPKLYRRAQNVLASFVSEDVDISLGRENADRHPTEKPEDLLRVLIEVTTAPGQLVADPYGGVASTAAAAKSATGDDRRPAPRRWWSCELDDGYWETGNGRLM